ncbi:ARF guanine-nucleotide exchange factor GNL2 [Dichanthelium oligosanthes]|uniref:ARF guanine-nucleotide exchange factor GNL2 n=1 Tax=Dichanthelium oligosanthes TaxID=888268 RepID=A0A1E5WGP5_9POAL|nr:ARF guanine-nucleotide exchange factor GNL2 [Dichanthelium oligosanthes]
MARMAADDDDDGPPPAYAGQRAPRRDPRLKDLGISCMLNTEVAALLAVIRRRQDPYSYLPPAVAAAEEATFAGLIASLKTLRGLLFQPRHGAWRCSDPSTYLTPFLDVVQCEEAQPAATGVALSSVLKILRIDVFDECSPGARDAVHAILTALTNCRIERISDAGAEEAVLLRVLQVLGALLRTRAAPLLSDSSVCTTVNTCFQIVQHAASSRGSELLRRTARHCMHEILQAVFARLPDIRDDADADDVALGSSGAGFGVRCMVDVFSFLCSLLLNAADMVVTPDGQGAFTSEEDVMLFSLVLVNSAVELGGEAIGKHAKLLRLIQDDLFYHLIHYATEYNPLVLSMICSTALNLYHFLRRFLKLQLEAFFMFVLLPVCSGANGPQLQEVAVEGLISFCRQPTFVIEMYVNYDCDPLLRNVFEEVGKLLCKAAFPASGPMATVQLQAFEGLVNMITTIADNVEVDKAPDHDAYAVDVSEYRLFWTERWDSSSSAAAAGGERETWVDFVRKRKLRKKKVAIAANHYNRDQKKGVEYLKLCHLVPTPPEPRSMAYFLRYSPGLDKNKIGEFLGDPDELNLKVLKEFTETFDFTGAILDTALRTYLETFRLPGESQKIGRILEAFSERFFEQQQATARVFATKDAAFILCYSLIMLNTDLHNPQVKKKMSEEDFIRNNRAIDDKKDLPREYLSELFRSISTNAITVFSSTATTVEMTPSRWADLVKRSRAMEPFTPCDFKHKLSREVFIAVSGPAVATLAAIFDCADDEETLSQCVEGLVSVARVARYGLEDVLDELLCCLCKFTTLLNPYATTEETLFTFSNELKPRMATLALFTIANRFGESVRGAWKNVVDCLLKLKRLKLLPPSVIDPDGSGGGGSERPGHRHRASSSDAGVIFPPTHRGAGTSRHVSGMIGRFSQFLSLDGGSESLLSVGGEFENNLKIIKQCQAGKIFTESGKLPDEALQNLGRALIFAAGGKGQKFSTPIEEEETVGFCWDLVAVLASANLHRFATFWPPILECFSAVSQLPLFSPCPFAEKAIVALFRVAVRLLSVAPPQRPGDSRVPEELVFKSINMMWKLDKEILDTCCEGISESIVKLLTEHAGGVQTPLGWKTLLHLLTVTGRHPETFDQSVAAMIKIMSDGGAHVTRFNYAAVIEAAFGFAALKISPLDVSTKILELMAESVNWLIQWHKSGYSDPGNSFGFSGSSSSSSSSSSSVEDASRMGNLAANMFIKLAEALRKTSLVRREEIRCQAVFELGRAFNLTATGDLDFGPAGCLACFNLVIFAMVDDLTEKTLEYSRREGAERETRSMEGTLAAAAELLADVFVLLLPTLAQAQGFRTFWLGVLRRMDTCMKCDLAAGGGAGLMQELVPRMLKRMIMEMKTKEVLVPREGDELWEITHIQIQWIAPAVKDELFPE